MPTPVPSSAFKAVRINSGDPLRLRIIKYFKFIKLFRRWYKYVYDDGGDFSPEFRRAICDIPCNRP